jgi:hypothetical protein
MPRKLNPVGLRFGPRPGRHGTCGGAEPRGDLSPNSGFFPLFLSSPHHTKPASRIPFAYSTRNVRLVNSRFRPVETYLASMQMAFYWLCQSRTNSFSARVLCRCIGNLEMDRRRHGPNGVDQILHRHTSCCIQCCHNGRCPG